MGNWEAPALGIGYLKGELGNWREIYICMDLWKKVGSWKAPALEIGYVEGELGSWRKFAFAGWKKVGS